MFMAVFIWVLSTGALTARADEILAISDTVVVMYEGRMIEIGKVDASTRERIGRAMTGAEL